MPASEPGALHGREQRGARSLQNTYSCRILVPSTVPCLTAPPLEASPLLLRPTAQITGSLAQLTLAPPSHPFSSSPPSPLHPLLSHASSLPGTSLSSSACSSSNSNGDSSACAPLTRSRGSPSPSPPSPPPSPARRCRAAGTPACLGRWRAWQATREGRPGPDWGPGRTAR